MIKILQGSAVTQTVLGGLTIIMFSGCKFHVVYVPKIMKIDFQYRQVMAKKYAGLLFWPTL